MQPIFNTAYKLQELEIVLARQLKERGYVMNADKMEEECAEFHYDMVLLLKREMQPIYNITDTDIDSIADCATSKLEENLRNGQ